MKHSIEELCNAYYGKIDSGIVMILKNSVYETIKNEIKKRMKTIKKLMKNSRNINKCDCCFAFHVCHSIYNYMGYTTHDGVRKFVKYICENIEEETDKTSLEIE